MRCHTPPLLPVLVVVMFVESFSRVPQHPYATTRHDSKLTSGLAVNLNHQRRQSRIYDAFWSTGTGGVRKINLP